jgi:hypothetical protein
VLFVAVLAVLAIQFSKSDARVRMHWLRAVILPNIALLLAVIPLIGWYNLRVTATRPASRIWSTCASTIRCRCSGRSRPLPPKEYSNANLRAAHQTEIDDYRRFHNCESSDDAGAASGEHIPERSVAPVSGFRFFATGGAVGAGVENARNGWCCC